MNEIAILLLAFGGADSIESIPSFLKNVMKGRDPSPEMIKTIQERYSKIGGESPLADLTRLQAAALEVQLKKKTETEIEVFVGMRYWRPFIKDAISEINQSGHKKIIAICMTPQKSNYSAVGYKKDLDESLNGLDKKPEVIFIPGWHDNKLFQEAVAEKINEAMTPFKESGQKTAVIFSAHSLPLNFMGKDDPYVNQVNESINGILSFTGELDWKLAYQSKGYTPGEWLEPSVESVIEDLPNEGHKNVLIVPLVFVSDHVETLYDIDIQYRNKAESLGLNFSRTESLNDSPKFIEALTEVVMQAISHEER